MRWTEGVVMLHKREQMWWLAACVGGLLVAAWAAGGFIGPLMAVFVILYLAGAVLVECEDRERFVPTPIEVHDSGGATAQAASHQDLTF